MTDRPPRLAADSIVHRYDGRTVLDAAYVDAVPGTVTALVGVTGAGKTTLLEIAAGVRQPTNGQVRWDGIRVARPSLASLGRRGLVYAPSTAWLGRRCAVRAPLELAAAVWDSDWRGIARHSGVESLLDRPAHSLSTGERRLVELALAWACRPAVLVADEPFRDLEPLSREAVARRLAGLARSGTAVLFADHDAQMVREVADRVFSIEQGRTRTVPEFRTRPIDDWYHTWAGGGSYI